MSFTFRFTIGGNLAPRLLSVTNPAEGVLLARFNVPMRPGSEFTSVASWTVAPVDADARELILLNVYAHPSLSETAVILYEGGGSIYSMTASGLFGADGQALNKNYDQVDFEILFGTPLDASVKTFNSVFGPLGILQRLITRRSVDRLVANRSLALGTDEQMRIRFAATTDGTAGRDGRPGARRT